MTPQIRRWPTRMGPTGLKFLTVRKVVKSSSTSTSNNSKMLLIDASILVSVLIMSYMIMCQLSHFPAEQVLLIHLVHFVEIWLLNAGLVLVLEYTSSTMGPLATRRQKQSYCRRAESHTISDTEEPFLQSSFVSTSANDASLHHHPTKTPRGSKKARSRIAPSLWTRNIIAP